MIRSYLNNFVKLCFIDAAEYSLYCVVFLNKENDNGNNNDNDNTNNKYLKSLN